MPLPDKVERQIDKAGLPNGGSRPFRPRLTTNRNGDPIIEKARISSGPRRGKKGYVDEGGQIWIRDRAHADVPDHWDVQIDGGEEYERIGLDGEPLD